MKKIRRLLGLYTESELVKFGNYMQNKETNEDAKGVWHSDVSNFKAKLLLIALAFGLMSSTCSTEEPISEFDCECETVYYQRQQTGWNGASPVYTFVEVASTGFIPADCETATDDYTLLNGEWFRVNCQTVE